MIKFVIKVFFFVAPFLTLYGVNILLFDQYQGDLVRLGYIYDNPITKSEINNRFKKGSINYRTFDKSTVKKKFDILTIGDSFSEMKEYGYQYYIGQNSQLEILHIPHSLTNKNQIQAIHDLALGDFFEKVKVKCVVLQCVQRSLIKRVRELKERNSLTHDSLVERLLNRHEIDKEYIELDLFKRSTLKIPLVNFLLHFQKKPLNSKTYKLITDSKQLFTNGYKNVLIFEDDIEAVQNYNQTSEIVKVNDALNKIRQLLKRKGIELYVLISPDKYNVYYSRLINNDFTEPHFFSRFQSLDKEYEHINAYDSIRSKLDSLKDLYYYDDSHWSPVTSEIIGNMLIQKIGDRLKRNYQSYSE